MKNLYSRRDALRSLTAAGLSLASFPSVFAEDARAGVPAPRLIWNSGGITVHAVCGKGGAMSPKSFSGPTAPGERDKYFVNGLTPAGIHCFLVTHANENRRTLVDTGMGDGGSRLPEGPSSLGAASDDIDTVLLTHMHIDHAGGLIRADGSPVFRRARILVSAPELRFWKDAAASRDMQRLLENAGGVDTAKRALDAYDGSFEEFAFGDVVLPG